MAIGLKIRDVRRFGRKLEKGVRTVGRGIARGADVFGAIATPIATAIGGPAAGIAVSKGVEGVKKLAQKAEQLTSKGNVGVVLNINTVGNVKIKFHLIHNKIMKTDKTKIEISVINLTKALIEEGLEAPDAPASTNFSMREENLYCIKFYSKPNMDVREVQSKITKIFSNEGLSKSSFQVRSEIYYYNGNISTSVCFSVPKVDSSGRLLKTFKRVKLKRQI